MNSLLTTTALVLALGTGALNAQTAAPEPAADPAAPAATSTATPPAITPPEGFMAEEVAFNAENLDGATVYDATGERIGEVHGLVFADGSTTMRDDAAAAEMTEPVAGGVAEAPEPDAGTTAEGGSAQMATEPAGTASDTPMAEGDRIDNVGSDAGAMSPTEATTPPAQGATDTDAASATPTADAGTTPTDATTPPAQTTADSATTDTTTPPPAPGTADTGSMGTEPGMDAGSAPAEVTTPPAQTTADSAATGTATTPPATGTAATPGEITEAVIDVGGFLGMGEHRVAVPVDDLVAYRKDTELRIYLPWTREQLTALPEYEEPM